MHVTLVTCNSPYDTGGSDRASLYWSESEETEPGTPCACEVARPAGPQPRRAAGCRSSRREAHQVLRTQRGIVEVDLAVEQGEIYGFLGPNGAGKTTTIRLLLDLLRPTSGRAFVFGIETTVDPVAIHRRVGYLPGEFALFDRLTGGQTIEYFANLRGGVDPLYQADLVARFDLDPSRRFREYSKGNKQKVGLVIALQHRPDLLVLDEPTSGLDPLVQQTFFELLRETVAEGRTAFLSSHILGEVEKTCDRVAIIRDGRLVRVDRVEALRDLVHHEVELRFAAPVDPPCSPRSPV